MTDILDWKIGVEVELSAPRGTSRLDLAEAVAAEFDGSVSRFFHQQSEESAVPGHPTFENLTPGFRVSDSDGNWIADFVDDLTLQLDFDKQVDGQPGWYRILADDPRLLRLASRHCSADAPMTTVLDPLAALFGTEAETHDGDLVRVEDRSGASVAICATLPGERERPCEIVTAPMAKDQGDRLGKLLARARAMGFFRPVEGATHIHFDAVPLCNAAAVARLIRLFDQHREALRRILGTNPNCVRLGEWAPDLVALGRDPEFAAMNWEDAREALLATDPQKYCDLNLRNLATGQSDKMTIELRILPATLDAERIMAAAHLFAAMLHACLHEVEEPFQARSTDQMIQALKFPSEIKNKVLDSQGSGKLNIFSNSNRLNRTTEQFQFR